MKVGLHYWSFSTPPETERIAATLAETARIAEQAGLSSFTVMDHFFQMEMVAPAEEPMLEGYTTLGYVAALTERMTLGLLVTGVMYRNPGILAKTVATLDVLSGGRGRVDRRLSAPRRCARRPGGTRRARHASAPPPPRP